MLKHTKKYYKKLLYSYLNELVINVPLNIKDIKIKVINNKNKNIMGEVQYNPNIIIININKIKNIKELKETLIHEYVHFSHTLDQYKDVMKLTEYNNNIYEIICNSLERKLYKFLKKYEKKKRV